MDVNSILIAIENMPIKEALKYLLAVGIKDLGKKGFESIKEKIKEKASKKRYGFVPNKDEGNFLIKVNVNPYFEEFKRLLPKNRYADLIRVGYLISHLNRTGGREDRKRVEIIRESICNQPNGYHLIKIVNLVTTGAIVPIIDFLNELKKKNYDKDYLTDAFDEILYDWQKISYFVKSQDSETKIYEDIKIRLKTNQKMILVFSYGSAKTNTTRAIARLNNEGLDKGYFYQSKNVKEGDKEVHSSCYTFLD